MAVNQQKVSAFTHGLLSQGQDGLSDKQLEEIYNQSTKHDIKQATIGGAFTGAVLGGTLGGMGATLAAGASVAAPPIALIAGLVAGGAVLGSVAGGVVGNVAGKWEREEGLGQVKLQYAAERGVARGVSQNGLTALSPNFQSYPTVNPAFGNYGTRFSSPRNNGSHAAWQDHINNHADFHEEGHSR